MARIFYSMSGEGRGHATRSRAIIDVLAKEHEVVVFAPGDAWELLMPAYRNTSVTIHKIPGLRFVYNKRRQVDLPSTVAGALVYTWRLPSLLRLLGREMQKRRPALVITDFEPALPRAATLLGIPVISIDHQHFLTANDLSALPRKLRLKAWMMGLIVRLMDTTAAHRVVSSFYQPGIRKSHEGAVTQAGVILRPSVLAAEPSRAGHLLVYLRKFPGENVLEALRDCELPVRVYGLGDLPGEEGITFCAISEEGFLRDLASCEALVTTAGNQLVGEALFLGKPVLALPEPNNDEQRINGFFLQREGAGETVAFEDMDTARLQLFLSRLDIYRAAIQPEKYNGTDIAVRIVRSFLKSHQDTARVPLRARWSHLWL